jgi:lipopolysaccharide/colanic/teichoic acid biosynthesis glycosyltransferase
VRIAWGLKRAVDVVGSAAGLVALSPLLTGIGLLIVLDSGWPPLFWQTRVGRGARRFCLCKFRTMVVGAEQKGAGLFFERDDPRFTRLGPFLRRTSLDELPQLWNVLIGDASLVGPRPMVPYMADQLDAQQARRHRVRPGITGWAQVSGRNELLWSRRIELDNWYIDHWTLWLDFRILWRTLAVVLTGAGARADQSARDVDDLGS